MVQSPEIFFETYRTDHAVTQATLQTSTAFKYHLDWPWPVIVLHLFLLTLQARLLPNSHLHTLVLPPSHLGFLVQDIVVSQRICTA